MRDTACTAALVVALMLAPSAAAAQSQGSPLDPQTVAAQASIAQERDAAIGVFVGAAVVTAGGLIMIIVAATELGGLCLPAPVGRPDPCASWSDLFFSGIGVAGLGLVAFGVGIGLHVDARSRRRGLGDVALAPGPGQLGLALASTFD